jgi:hypothetical protein
MGDLYDAYPGFPGGSRRWEQSVLPGQHGRQANSMSAQVLPPLAVNSKSEQKVHSLGFELVIIGMLAHLSNHFTKSHPTRLVCYLQFRPDTFYCASQYLQNMIIVYTD